MEDRLEQIIRDNIDCEYHHREQIKELVTAIKDWIKSEAPKKKKYPKGIGAWQPSHLDEITGYNAYRTKLFEKLGIKE